jgi:hypothetical protein
MASLPRWQGSRKHCGNAEDRAFVSCFDSDQIFRIGATGWHQYRACFFARTKHKLQFQQSWSATFLELFCVIKRLILFFSKAVTLYPGGIRSHDPLLPSPRWQAETIPLGHTFWLFCKQQFANNYVLNKCTIRVIKSKLVTHRYVGCCVKLPVNGIANKWSLVSSVLYIPTSD